MPGTLSDRPRRRFRSMVGNQTSRRGGSAGGVSNGNMNHSSSPELTYAEGQQLAEELMRLLALTVTTATVLAFAVPQTSRVLAQGSDTGAVGRPLQLDGGPSLGSDNRGQSSGGGSERSEPSAGVRSENNQTHIGKTGETTV